MDDDRSKIKHPQFVLSVVIVAAILGAIAVWVSLRVGIGTGITVLLAGVIVGGIGAMLALPSPDDPENPANRLDLNSLMRQNEHLADQEAYNRQHTAPLWGFEDVMLWAGLIDILIGILLFVLPR